jgi:hypothetical protein
LLYGARGNNEFLKSEVILEPIVAAVPPVAAKGRPWIEDGWTGFCFFHLASSVSMAGGGLTSTILAPQ